MVGLDSIIQRLRWARECTEHAHQYFGSLVGPHFYDLELKQEGKGRLVVRVTKNCPVPTEFSFLVGDAAHNIRAALDNLAFAIVKPQPEIEKRVYFPICTQSARWPTECRSKLPGVTRRVRAAFEELQPYHRRKMPASRYLVALNILNNWDKHRQLAVCTTYAASFRPNLTVSAPEVSVTERRVRQGILKSGAILASYKVTGVIGHAKVRMKPEVVLTPVFDVGMPKEFRMLGAIEVLKRTIDFSEQTVLPRLAGFV